MTTEQLLIPRYEVVGLWPYNCPYRLGDIINQSDNLEGASFFKNIDQYPHLFKPLPWYHGRKIEEMPGYVKVVSQELSFIYGTIIKANRWGIYPDEGHGFGNEGDFYAGITQPIKTNAHDAGEEITINVCHLTPALESDYITFINREK